MVARGQIRRLSTTGASLLCFAMLFTNCAVGPKYSRPVVPVPTVYKELPAGASRDWKPAHPGDLASRGQWWERFADPELNSLENRLNASNYSIAGAPYDCLSGPRGQYYPTITADPGISYSRLATAFGQTVGRTFTSYSFPLDISWEPDLWNRIRQTVSANAAAAQASVADLENVRLSAQAELAEDYFQLRTQDSLKRLWDSVVSANQESVALVRDQSVSGLGSDEALAAVQAELHSALAQDANLAVGRAQYEHAIAVLIGEPASTFSLSAAGGEADPPSIPVGVPSELLERRPDIAGAERAVAQANAHIGIARTAFFPTVMLSVSAGFESLSISKWLQWPARVWSLGPSVAETLFDAGQRRATVQQFQATYDSTVANYRQTVLTAFQEVEDHLAALKTLSGVIEEQDSAIGACRRALEVAEVRYTAGLDPYLNVISARISLLAAQQAGVTLRMQRMVASVQLIKALGGGWDSSEIPSPKELERRIPRASNNGN